MSAGPLAQLSEAVRLLSEARTLDQVTHIRSMAQAAEQYARAEKLGDEAEHHAREVRLRAARKAGDLLRQMKDSGQRQASGDAGGRGHRLSSAPTINDLGISRDHASRWQKLAAVPDDDFEKKVAEGWGETAIARGGRVPRKPQRPITPKTKTNGFTYKQSFRGLQSAAVQLQSLAEALDGGSLGDWSRLHSDQDAQQLFQILEDSLPIVGARVKRALREWKEGNAA